MLDRNVMAPAAKRLKHGLAFQPQDRAGLSSVFDRLSANLRIAGAVFMTEDGCAARTLAAEKETFRDLEARATASCCPVVMLAESHCHTRPGGIHPWATCRTRTLFYAASACMA